jgi:hypothetical protein
MLPDGPSVKNIGKRSFEFVKQQRDLYADEILVNQALPAIGHPAAAIVRISPQRPLIFLFGGHGQLKGVPLNTMVAIDPTSEKWWYVDIEGEPPLPRIGASMVSVGNQLFIFDGIAGLTTPLEYIMSYSILEYTCNKTRGTWRWVKTDVAYPVDIQWGRGGHGWASAHAVYEGKMILLLLG